MTKRWQGYKVTILTEHEIFIKNHHLLDSLKKSLQQDLNSIVTMPVEEVEIVPDYDKLEI